MKRLLAREMSRMRSSFFLLALLSLLVILQLSSYSSLLATEPQHLKLARQYVGKISETNNRGYWIDVWNRVSKAPLGSPYCTSFWKYIFGQAGVKSPTITSALALSVKSKESFSAFDVMMGRKKVLKGYVLTWQNGRKTTGHMGCASVDWKGTWGMSIQANTSAPKGLQDAANQRDGNGVWEKLAAIVPTSYFRIVRITPVRY